MSSLAASIRVAVGSTLRETGITRDGVEFLEEVWEAVVRCEKTSRDILTSIFAERIFISAD